MTGIHTGNGTRHFPEDSFWQILEQTIASWESAQSADAGPSDWDGLRDLVQSLQWRHRQRVLIELVVLEFERQSAIRPDLRVEDVLQQFPELAEDLSAIEKLVREEIFARRDSSAEALADELKQRFPEVDVSDILTELQQASCQRATLTPSLPPELLNSLSARVTGHLEKREFTPLPPGTLLGRYRVVKLLGRGGMGIVYLGFDDELDRKVAIKVLYPWINEALAADELLLNEARLAAQIKHPAIIDVYDIGLTETGDRFVVMDYDHYRPLDQVLKEEGLLPKDDVIRIATQIAEGLAVAHQRGILHRDIKPANILIDAMRNARLTDFGLAIPVDQTTTSERSGTISYMAPELVARSADNTAVANIQTDVWAFGIVLYELLTGTRPFGGRDIETISRAIQEHQPPTPQKLNPTVPRWLDDLCMGCLEKDPGKRFKTADEVLKALERRPQNTSRVPVWSGVSIVIVILAALAWWGSSAWNGDASALSSFNDGICPVLRENCKLVVTFDSEEKINFDNQRDYNAMYAQLQGALTASGSFSYNQFLRLHDAPLQFSSQDDWLFWSTRVDASYPIHQKNRSQDAAFTYGSSDLKLFFAVNRDGRFQVGTASTRDEDHLLPLAAPFRGVPNYRRILSTQDLGKLLPHEQYYSRSEYVTPVDALISLDEKQNWLTLVAIATYHSFHELGIVAETEQEKTVPKILDSNQIRLVNYFEQPITIIDGALYSHLVRDAVNGQLALYRDKGQDELPEEFRKVLIDVELADSRDRSALPNETEASVDRPVFNARDFNDGDPQWFRSGNVPWRYDPAIDAKRELAVHRLVTRFNFPEWSRAKSVSTFFVQSDNRNATRITVRGLNRVQSPDERLFDDDLTAADGISRSDIELDETNRTIRVSQWNVGGASVALFDRTFDQVEVEALQQWSIITPWFRYIVLGELDESVIESSEATATIHRVVPYRQRTEADGDDWQHLQFAADWDSMASRPVLRRYSRDLRPRRLVIPSTRRHQFIPLPAGGPSVRRPPSAVN